MVTCTGTIHPITHEYIVTWESHACDTDQIIKSYIRENPLVFPKLNSAWSFNYKQLLLLWQNISNS